MNYTIKNADIEIYNDSESFSFPKYTSQLINWANQNAQGTRPKVVGQMSELFPEFLESDEEKTIEGWRKWYTERYPDAFQNATDKIWEQVVNLKNAIPLIDKEMVEHWVEDLVVYKTFNGLYVQKAILASLAKKKWTTYRLATPEEESKGIDGYVGNTPYQVKADTYKTMGRLSEVIFSIARAAISSSISTPRLFRFEAIAANVVVPKPAKGSKTVSPSAEYILISL